MEFETWNLELHKKIPVIIVTGFLGAGKTTFLNEVIRNHQHLKLALVENEFGQQSIDQDLIVGMRSENIFDLSNGCICCSISNEFSLTLLDLAEKAGDEIDFLLIETTGIADLSNVIRPLYSDEELKEKYTLAGSVCLVDAANYTEQMNGREQQMQVILSDLLLINKIDTVLEKEVDEISRNLSKWNGTAKIKQTSFGQLPFSLEAFAEKVQGKIEQKLGEPILFRLIESKKYTTFTHEFPGNIKLDRFKYWFDYFAAINQREIYRIKGMLFTEDSPNKVIVQSVGGATNYSEGSMILPGENPNNRLVFIGKEIDFERIGYELDKYLSEDLNP